MLKDFMEGDFSFIWTRPSLDSISALSSEKFLPHTDTVRLLEMVKSTIDTDGVQGMVSELKFLDNYADDWQCNWQLLFSF